MTRGPIESADHRKLDRLAGLVVGQRHRSGAVMLLPSIDAPLSLSLLAVAGFGREK